MRARIQIPLFMLLLCASVFMPQKAISAEQGAVGGPKEPMDNLVVILSSDDLPSADAAIRIAGVAAQRGHKVTMLLRVKAIQLALKDTDYKVGDTTYQDKLANFMKAGSKVFVGPDCMKLEGIPKEKLIPGVVVGTKDTVMGIVFEKDTRIICQ